MRKVTTNSKIGKPLSLTISALMITSLVAVLLATAGTVAGNITPVDEWDGTYVDNVLYVDDNWENSDYVPDNLTFGENAFRSIENAVAAADSTENNVIEVATGTYDSSIESFPISVKTSGLTIRAASGATPVIDAAGVEIGEEEGIISVVISDDAVTIDGLTLKNATGGNESGIYAQGPGVNVYNCTIENTRWGIQASASLTMENNTIKDSTDVGLLLIASGTVRNNVFENNATGAMVYTNSVSTFENNTFRDNGFASIVFKGNSAGNATVENNNFMGTADYAIVTSGGGSELTAENNWWNDEGGPLADADGDGTFGENYWEETGSIDVAPWLDAPYPDGESIAPVQFDQDYYTWEDEPQLTVYNGPWRAENGDDIRTDNITVTVTSTKDSTGITVTLVENTVDGNRDTGVFIGSFSIENYQTGPGTSVLGVAVEDTATSSIPSVWANMYASVTATVDDNTPVIDNIVMGTGTAGQISDNYVRENIVFTVNFSESNPEDYVFEIDDENITPVTSLDPSATSANVTENMSTYADGDHTVSVTITDKAGNSGTLSRTITVDNTAPTLSNAYAQVADYPENTMPADTTENVNVFVDVLEEGSGIASVTATLGDNTITLNDQDGDGTYDNTFTNVSKSEGTYTIEITATDNVSLVENTGITLEVGSVALDTKAPIFDNLPSVTYPAGQLEAKPGQTITISAVVSDNTMQENWQGIEKVEINAENLGLGTTMAMVDIGENIYEENLTISSGFENYGTRQLTVTATDNANNTTTATVDVEVVSSLTKYEVEIEEEWNLISLPLIPDNSAIESVLAGLDVSTDNVKSVWYWDAQNDEWLAYKEGVIETLATMEDGKGYWINMETSATLTVEGVVLKPGMELPPSYDLYEGWNMLGFKSTSSAGRDNYLGTATASVTEVVYEWDPISESYTSIGSTDMLTPGVGYWIAVSDNTTVYP